MSNLQFTDLQQIAPGIMGFCFKNTIYSCDQLFWAFQQGSDQFLSHLYNCLAHQSYGLQLTGKLEKCKIVINRWCWQIYQPGLLKWSENYINYIEPHFFRASFSFIIYFLPFFFFFVTLKPLVCGSGFATVCQM